MAQQLPKMIFHSDEKFYLRILIMSEVTQALDVEEEGDLTASEKLLPLVYEDLRRQRWAFYG